MSIQHNEEMSSQPKNTNKIQGLSRFDFSKGRGVDDRQSGTLRELLDDLDPKYAPAEGAEITLDSLETTRTFIHELTGRTHNSLTESLPLSTLKTIKLLYLHSKKAKTQLFRHLQAPHDGARPTLEFRITGNAPRNKMAVKAINDLVMQLALEIPSDRRDYIDGMLLRKNALLECIVREQAQILEPLHAAFGHAPPALREAVKALTLLTAAYEPSTRLHREPPLHEALYTRIRALPLLHFVGEYQTIIERAQLTAPVPPIHDQIAQFCEVLPKKIGVSIQPHNPIMSIQSLDDFVDEHALPLAKLIKQATGISSNRRDLLNIRNQAAKVLHAHLFHQSGPVNLSETRLSVSDCVAALCTIRQQQNGAQKIPYTPRWIGQKSSETTRKVFNQLDRDKPIEALYEEDYIPHGTLQLLYHRFCALHAAFVDQTDTHRAWMAFRIAHLKAYATCHACIDIDGITLSLRGLDDYCMRCAEEIVHQATLVVLDNSSTG